MLKEISPVKRAPLPNIIKAVQYKPEIWSSTEPYEFDATKIGIKGSPTIVGKAYTPPPKEPGDVIAVSEKGLDGVVAYALGQIGQAEVVEFIHPETVPDGDEK